MVFPFILFYFVYSKDTSKCYDSLWRKKIQFFNLSIDKIESIYFQTYRHN